MSLHDKTALITGAGATGGIGFQIAKLLADDGAEVVISGRDEAQGRQAVEQLGDRARFIRADLSDLAQVEELAEAAGDVDILVNNAATITVNPVVDQDVASYEDVFAVNVRAPYFLTSALAPKMIANGGGSIINISTMVAQVATPGMSVYGASKAALESLTRTWAAELGPAGIRVNTVSPGPTSSEKVMTIMGDVARELGKDTLLARMADPAEVAQAVYFLATDRSSYITGAYVPVDGGRVVA